MSLDIRDAIAQDAEAMVEIQVSGWQFAYWGLMPQDFLDSLNVSQRIDRYRHFIVNAPKGTYHRVAVLNGEVVAVSLLAPSRDSVRKEWGEVVVFYALPQVVGQRIGYALMQEMLWQFSKPRAITTFICGYLRETNGLSSSTNDRALN